MQANNALGTQSLVLIRQISLTLVGIGLSLRFFRYLQSNKKLPEVLLFPQDPLDRNKQFD